MNGELNMANGNFTKAIMEAVVAVILLTAVAIPIINGMPTVSGANASIINTLVGIIPVLLAVAVILGVVYAVILKPKSN